MRILVRRQRQPPPVDHREQGRGVRPHPGEALAEHHAGSAAGGAQSGHGQHQRLSVKHPDPRTLSVSILLRLVAMVILGNSLLSFGP